MYTYIVIILSFFNCFQIHGDRTQGHRESALGLFRDGKTDVLIATDAISRGIDIPDVVHGQLVYQ